METGIESLFDFAIWYPKYQQDTLSLGDVKDSSQV